MAAYFAQGRLGTEIANLPLYGLWMLVEHSPHDDHWMKGGSLDAIIARIAKLEGSKVCDVNAEVRKLLAAKAEKHKIQERVYNYAFPMGGSMILDALENGTYGEWL